MNTYTYKGSLEAIKAGRDISYWLQRAVEELAGRDPVDSFNDATILRNIMAQRIAEEVGQ